MAPSPEVRPRMCSALGPDTLNVMGSDPPVWISTFPEVKYQSNTSSTPSLRSARRLKYRQDLVILCLPSLARRSTCAGGAHEILQFHTELRQEISDSRH